MSLLIDSRRICAVYALGQWFNIKPDSFVHDAFELRIWEEDVPFGNESNNPNKQGALPREPRASIFAMGALYHMDEPEPLFTSYGSGRQAIKNPGGSHGIQFIDADTGLRVSMSIMEVKAFREMTEDQVVQRRPELKRWA